MIVEVGLLRKEAYARSNSRIAPVPAQNAGAASRGKNQAHKDLQGCRLPCSIGAKKPKHLSLLNLKTQALESSLLRLLPKSGSVCFFYSQDLDGQHSLLRISRVSAQSTCKAQPGQPRAAGRAYSYLVAASRARDQTRRKLDNLILPSQSSRWDNHKGSVSIRGWGKQTITPSDRTTAITSAYLGQPHAPHVPASVIWPAHS